jgi:hypothetical protein
VSLLLFVEEAGFEAAMGTTMFRRHLREAAGDLCLLGEVEHPLSGGPLGKRGPVITTAPLWFEMDDRCRLGRYGCR